MLQHIRRPVSPAPASRTPLRLVLLGLCVAFGMSACQTPYEEGRDVLTSGRWDAREKRERDALIKYRRTQRLATLEARKHPNDPRYQLLLAESLLAQAQLFDQQDRISEADHHYKKALTPAETAFRSKKYDAAAGRVLGKIYYELQRPYDATRAWKRARKADPKSVQKSDYQLALTQAIFAERGLENYDRVLELISELKQLAPNNPEASEENVRETRERLAAAKRDERDYKTALRLYDQLSAKYPNEASYHRARGEILLAVGREDEALRAFDRYIKAPSRLSVSQRLHETASIATRKQARGIAIALNQKLLKTYRADQHNKLAKTHQELFQLHVKVKQFDRARTHAQEFLKHQRKSLNGPPNTSDYTSLAQYAHDTPLREELLEQALREAKPSKTVVWQLARIHAENARNVDVDRVWRAFIKRSTNKQDALREAARWAQRRRAWQLARGFYEELIKDPSSTASDLRSLADIYGEQNETKLLRKTLTAYLKKEKNTAKLRDAARLFKQYRMFDDAEKIYQRMIKKTPKDFYLNNELADMYRVWGKKGKIHDLYAAWIKSNGDKGSDYYKVARRLHYRAPAEALPYYKKAAEKGNNNAWYEIAQTYRRQRRDFDMKHALEQYIKGSRSRTSALSSALRLYQQAGMDDQSIKLLVELVEKSPRRYSYYQRLGDLYIKQGQDRAAIKLWEKYLQKMRGSTYAFRNMTSWFERKGQQAWLLRFYERQLSKPNPSPELYKLVGDTFHSINYQRTRRISRGTSAQSTAHIQEPAKQAKRFYQKYFDTMPEQISKLNSFANDMKGRQQWAIASQAYEKLFKLPNASRRYRYSLLNHGEVLLKLGEPLKGEEKLAEYYKLMGRSSQAAGRVASVLMGAGRMRAAEPYLLEQFKKVRGYRLQRQFRQLAQLYRQTDQTGKLRRLINDYLARSQNPQNARSGIASELANAGLWKLAAEQLEQLSVSRQNNRRFEIAEYYWRAGQREKAEALFRDYASAQNNRSNGWLRVATFYEQHAEPRLAMQGYNSAISTAPDNPKPYAGRGRFRALQGDLTGSAQDFKKAVAKAPQSTIGNIYQIQAETLKSIGQIDEANKVLRRALALPNTRKAGLLTLLAATELTSGDPVRADRIIDELRLAAMPLDKIVGILRTHHYMERAARMIEDELIVGDHVAATKLLVQHADLFTSLGGIPRLMTALQPALNRSTDNGVLHAQLGDFLVRQGLYREGIVHLKAGLAQTKNLNTNALPLLLGHAQLAIGQEAEAARSFQQYLRAIVKDEEKAQALQRVFTRYEQLNKPDAQRRLLQQLARDSGYSKHATPLLFDLMLNSGQLSNVLGSLRGLMRPTSTTTATSIFDMSSAKGDRDAVFLAGVRTLASHGFVAEARALLGEADAALKKSVAYRKLHFRVVASEPGADVTESLGALFAGLDASRDDAQLRLEAARLLMLTDRHKLARPIAESALRAPITEVSEEAYKILIGSARVLGDVGRIDEWTGAFLENTEHRMNARRRAATLLHIIGLDKRAAQLTLRNANNAPTGSNINSAMISAHHTADARTFPQLAKDFWRVDYRPMRSARSRLGTWSQIQPPALTRSLLVPYRKTYPRELQMRLNEAFLYLRTGEVAKMRTILTNTLKENSFDPHTTEQILGELTTRALYSEAAKFVAPMVPAEKLTPRAHLLIGTSLAALGLKDEAPAHLDTYVKQAPDPAHAAYRITLFLLTSKQPALAKRYVEEAQRRAPNRPSTKLVHALWRIAIKSPGDIDADLNAAAYGGINRHLVYHYMTDIATQYNALDRVKPHLLKWARSASGSNELLGLLMTLSVLEDTKTGARFGLKFMEKHYPRLTAPHNVAYESLIPALSNLHEKAGNTDASHKLYEEQLQRAFMLSTTSGEMSTYLNNLAYGYSTANKNIKKGEQLVLKSLALEDERKSSVIDTLGWIYYRQRKYPLAEAEIRRAIRSTNGRPQQLIELYRHLADIREARGSSQEAVWLRVYADSLEAKNKTTTP